MSFLNVFIRNLNYLKTKTTEERKPSSVLADDSLKDFRKELTIIEREKSPDFVANLYSGRFDFGAAQVLTPNK